MLRPRWSPLALFSDLTVILFIATPLELEGTDAAELTRYIFFWLLALAAFHCYVFCSHNIYHSLSAYYEVWCENKKEELLWAGQRIPPGKIIVILME